MTTPVSDEPEITVGTYVRKFDGAGFEGEVMSVYRSRLGVWMAVVEITAGPFAGMQHIYRLRQLNPIPPSEWVEQWKNYVKANTL
ncbi:MAG: hypothetical protein ACK5PJ_07870 [Ralstonia sp.]|jgi:hypothetical protein